MRITIVYPESTAASHCKGKCSKGLVVSLNVLALCVCIPVSISYLAGRTAGIYYYNSYRSDNSSSALNIQLNNKIGSSILTNEPNASSESEDEDDYDYDYDYDEDDDDNEHKDDTTAEQLLFDINNVDAKFLMDEKSLAQALVQTATGLDLISYHCHSSINQYQGVACIGAMSRGNIGIHTSPRNNGTILVDLFLSGQMEDGYLLEVRPSVEELFAIPRAGSGLMPTVNWQYKFRGFTDDDFELYPLAQDIGDEIFETWGSYKKKIFSGHTQFQRVDIYDDVTRETGRFASYVPDDELVPERMLFLDGVIQSTQLGDEAYHETLVHPAMFAHYKPKRVAIVGGGEGGTLREVLKHDTVKHVKMIEIDAGVIEFCREHFPSINDCSDIIESSGASCFDDARADVICEDATAWFIDNFGEYEEEEEVYDYDYGEYEEEDDDEDRFDVIILDALDPMYLVPEFADVLYNDDQFMPSIFNALTDDGVMVIQLGQSPKNYDPDEFMSQFKKRSEVVAKIGDLAESMHVFEEAHCGFLDPWSFLIACKSKDCRYNFYKNEAELELAIHRRLRKTYSGGPPLKYFDGATMKQYQVPSRAWQKMQCKQTPTPLQCTEFGSINSGFYPNAPHFPSSVLEVKASSMGENVGRGIFATVDIPKGALIGQELAGYEVYFSPLASGVLYRHKISSFTEYIEGYSTSAHLQDAQNVDANVLAFTNHGCHGTYNIGFPFDALMKSYNEADASFVPSEEDLNEFLLLNKNQDINSWSPISDRHINHRFNNEYALRDIRKGEELFSDYATYESLESPYLASYVADLKLQCSGKLVGLVVTKERSKKGI